MGILFCDEIKNLQTFEAITLLTVLEDGQLPITLRSGGEKSSGTAAMAVSTDPVPCLTLLVAAGNFDSIPQIHPALMDRIAGYGRVVRMDNDMVNTVENRRKIIQFIAQETQRFEFACPPFSRGACEEVVGEFRRRSGKRGRLTTQFRPMISVIKTAGTLAKNEGIKSVLWRHVEEAINEHCKSIEQQLLDKNVEEERKLRDIRPEGEAVGEVYGLAVVGKGAARVGKVAKITGFIKPREPGDRSVSRLFRVTGISKEPQWIDDSADKVRTVILNLLDVDLKKYYTHVDFNNRRGSTAPAPG